MWRYILFGVLAGMIALALYAYGVGWLSYFVLGFEAPSYSWQLYDHDFRVWLMSTIWLGVPLGGASAYAWKQWSVGKASPAIAVCRWIGIICMVVIALKPQFQYSLQILPQKCLSLDYYLVYWVPYLDFQWAFFLVIASVILRRENRKMSHKTHIN